MNWIENLISPLSLVFIVLILGYYLGNIKCWGISLDLSGVLIVAVLFGCVVISNDTINEVIDIRTLKNNMQIYSSLGTALFVSVIGITAGYSFNLRTLKNARAILIGFLMVLSSFMLMKLISVLDKGISYSKLLGALCGALTTTPGLSAITELDAVISGEAMLAYGGTYLLGVIATMLCVQLFAKKSNMVVEIEEKISDENHSAIGGLLQIGITIILGQVIGTIRLGAFTIGQSGGVLCVGIVLGMIVKKCFSHKIASAKAMGLYRNFGLVLFFVGNGIPAGMSLSSGFDVKLFFYGTLMSIVPICSGVIFSKLFSRDNSVSSIVAGGMTSTPAVGVLLRKQCQVSLESYSMAYVGALLTIILLVRSCGFAN